MPKRKSPEDAGGKDTPKVTKQEPTRRSERLQSKPAPPKPEAKPKKTIVKPVEDKTLKAKKSTAKGRKEDAPAHNGKNKTGEIYVSRPCVSVTFFRSSAPAEMTVRGQNKTVRVKGDY
ncbi:high mobility group nucleosome-binding domain-containing protein 3 [Aplochiton taeniatus]